MMQKIKTLEEAAQAFEDLTNLWREGSIQDDSAIEGMETISQRVRDIATPAGDAAEAKHELLTTLAACCDSLRDSMQPPRMEA